MTARKPPAWTNEAPFELGADVEAAAAVLEAVLEEEADEADDRDADEEELADALELILALELADALEAELADALELVAEPVAPEMTNAGEKLTLLAFDESTIWKLYAAPLSEDPDGMVKVAVPADAETVAIEWSA